MMINVCRYRKRVASYNERVQELNDITQERDDIKRQYDEWRKRRCEKFTLLCLLSINTRQLLVSNWTDARARLDEFMAGFNIISLKLKEMYQVNVFPQANNIISLISTLLLRSTILISRIKKYWPVGFSCYLSTFTLTSEMILFFFICKKKKITFICMITLMLIIAVVDR